MTVPDYTRIRQEMASRGLRPSPSVYDFCPRVVAGKRCLKTYPPYRRCHCQAYRSLFDHGRVWIASGTRHVVTGDPYHIDTHEWMLLRQHCAELDLPMPTQHAGLWYPGHTTLIVVGPRPER